MPTKDTPYAPTTVAQSAFSDLVAYGSAMRTTGYMWDDTSMGDTGALIVGVATVTGVLVGGGLQVLQQRRTSWSSRQQAAEDRLWAARRETYAEFLVAFNGAAHVLGNLAPRAGREPPAGPAAREYADYNFDRTVTPALRALELVASPDAAHLANEAVRALIGFRTRMIDPHAVVPAYQSETYEQHYQPAREARERFLAQAVEDLRTAI
jgi:hypothetical protein